MTPHPATTALPSWGQENFGAARLRDQRRTRSLVDSADRILAHPGGSLPDPFADPNARQRCYTLRNSPAVTHAAVLAPHRQHTFGRLRPHRGVARFVADATGLDYTGQRSLAAHLGQVGGGQQRGYIGHSVWAIDPGGRGVLGLAEQVRHVRAEVPAGETRAPSSGSC
jgi:hypothetical protein